LRTSEFPLLDKPYAVEGLARKLRKLLDRPKPRKRRARGAGGRADSAPAAAAE